jgi:hypothetical protein
MTAGLTFRNRRKRLRRPAGTRLLLACQAGFDKAFEKRMRFIGLALKFRVILAREKIGVIAQFDQFGEGAIRRRA